MNINELNNLTFAEAVERLAEEKDQITTLEQLKDFAIHHIKNDNFYLAIHVLDAIQSNYADYYDYDYSMGTLDKPTALKTLQDLQDYCEILEDNTYQVRAHINSLGGKMDIVTVLEVKKDGIQTFFIVDYKGIKCTAIFNPFVCEYYADDKYGIIKETDDEN